MPIYFVYINNVKFRRYFDENFFDEMSSSEKLSEMFFDDVYPPKIYFV